MSIIESLIIIIGIIIGLSYFITFSYSMIQEKRAIIKCEEDGLGLIYPPFEKFAWKKPCYCGNITEINQTYMIKQTICGWWYFEDGHNQKGVELK